MCGIRQHTVGSQRSNNIDRQVNAAHLRPLQRDQLSLSFRAKGYWNPIAAGDESEAEIDYVEFQEEARKPDDLVAENSALTCDQFTRAWRTIEDCQAKFRYLESFKYASINGRGKLI